MDLKLSYSKKKYMTEKYNKEYTLIRRNTPFYISLKDKLNQNFNEEKIKLTKRISNSYNFSVEIMKKYKYRAIKICTTNNTSVGEYYLKVKYKNYTSLFLRFIIIFNPYDETDDTYIKNIFNYSQFIDTEYIVTFPYGVDISQSSLHIIDQFSENFIKAASFVMKEMEFCDRGKAFKVSQFMSKWVNSDGMSGILVPSWSNYPFSIDNPINFSKKIFQEYLEKKIPIKYGQCVEFNVILCSLLRTIGIGCRVVTGTHIFHTLNLNEEEILHINAKNLNIINGNFHEW
ncbi:hypothetical protein MXB_735 [Myxobolus squamalis]|nr:hypothetical protein MXB_735 [Myxobolus squamalis]